MMTESFGPNNPLRLLQWQYKSALFYAATATIAWVLVDPVGLEFLKLPIIPLTIVGSAIGIFTSFRANQAYDRWWEGRKLWGRMINSSRHFCNQVIRYLGPEDRETAEAIVLRHCGYVHALRCLLRKQDPFADADFQRNIPDADALRDSTNLTHALLDKQLIALTGIAEADRLDGLRLQSLDSTLMDLLNIQGGCERIKGTPLPRGYGFIAEALIQLFAILLPFSLVHEMGPAAIPANVLVCLAFALISEAGRVLEDPFSMYYNGLPLHALSIKIERNLRQRLGKTELPEAIKASPLGVLM
ncbi:MAG: putative membrane protein [Myxococcota bacterium]|jgi:putative membrane protein